MTGVPEIFDRPSPNRDARPDGTQIDILLLHYTGMRTAEAALERLTDSAAKVSAHYLIEENGTCWRLVGEEQRAWHAGVASWAGASDINARSIGIELVNPGHQFGYRRFPPAQMQSLSALSLDIIARREIPQSRVLGHSDVAPERKEDPGELFDWAGLAKSGVGLWPEPSPSSRSDMAFEEAMRLLSHIGYAAPETQVMNAGARNILLAFQRRWLPSDLTGALTPETAARIRDVHAAHNPS
ncbi:N-acetylmuramoyl-L-alanine amidase [Nisaea acidiphila]|uniref:N-acetylmuramoyl-L-alanine amidase n=1 Tax=Nisaea acidiphila TaxID=1862145 RepID=A0A9J7AXT7_9PROT|nr:N-acetylmuramoyl-L-alanine amidase [Nisaea acidiphila]UUX51249.1 N-acetylmuramoyl-L-alanine amidase [Nisaea acidiphila]